MQTVHYHAITWCYLCSVNQYASFGTPQAYSGGNKNLRFFAKNSINARQVQKIVSKLCFLKSVNQYASFGTP